MYFETPAVTTTLNGISEWFNPIFSDFLPWGMIAIAVILGFGAIAWLVRIFASVFHRS